MHTTTISGSARKYAIRSMVSVCILFIFLIPQLILVSFCLAGLIERVVAYVDDQAITYSEFSAKFESMKKVVPGISEEEAVNSMINTLLLLDQARKMRLEGASDDDLIKEYVDIKIKSRVFEKEVELTDYYDKHKEEFGGKDYLEVRDVIEEYILEVETNKRLKEHLAELREKSNIVIQLRDK